MERDRRVAIASQTVRTGVKRIFADTNPNLDIDGADTSVSTPTSR